MPFDDAGIWNPGISIYPGTAGGANAGLDILNAFKGQQNADAEQAKTAMLLKLMMAQSPNAQAAFNDPQAATAARSTPEQMSQFYDQTPGAQARYQYKGLTDDEQSDPLNIQQIGLSTGAIPFQAGESASIRYQSDLDKNARAAASIQQRAEAARGKLGIEGAKLGLSPTQSIAYSQALTKLDPSLLANITDEQLPIVAQRIALMSATAGDRAAQGEKARMATSLMPTDVGSKIAGREAQAASALAGAGLKSAQAGQVGTETTRKTAADLVKANQDIAALSEGKNFKLALAKGGDDKKKALSDLANLTATRDAIAVSLRNRGITKQPATIAGPTVVATGVEKGTNRKVEKLSDGSTRYADQQ